MPLRPPHQVLLQVPSPSNRLRPTIAVRSPLRRRITPRPQPTRSIVDRFIDSSSDDEDVTRDWKQDVEANASLVQDQGLTETGIEGLDLETDLDLPYGDSYGLDEDYGSSEDDNDKSTKHKADLIPDIPRALGHRFLEQR